VEHLQTECAHEISEERMVRADAVGLVGVNSGALARARESGSMGVAGNESRTTRTIDGRVAQVETEKMGKWRASMHLTMPKPRPPTTS